MILRRFAGFVAALCLLAGLARAGDAELTELERALGLPQIIAVMQDEGRAYGADIAQTMLPGGASPRWTALVNRIYDADKMTAVVSDGFRTAMGDTDTAPLLAFFHSDTGKEIVRLEVAARRAFIDESTEAAARVAFLDMPENDRFLKAVSEYIDVNELVEFNVVGGMNSNYMFYRGLIEGGAVEMDEAEILADVWSEEEATRTDTREWMFAFLLMAYRPLDVQQIEAYTALSRTPEGAALNRALFAGFDRMYSEISLSLGLATAQMMGGEDL